MMTMTNAGNLNHFHKFICSFLFSDAIALQKEREERVRRVRELQEDERRKKLEELRHHVCFL